MEDSHQDTNWDQQQSGESTSSYGMYDDMIDNLDLQDIETRTSSSDTTYNEIRTTPYYNNYRIRNDSNTSKSDILIETIITEEATIPLTPALIEITPNPDYEFQSQQGGGDNETDEVDVTDEDDDTSYRYRRRSWANQKLAEVIFSHPKSLRTFCLEAYESAREKQQQQQCSNENDNQNTEEQLSTTTGSDEETIYIPDYEGIIIHSIPLSIASDTCNVCIEMTLDFSFATVRITVMTIQTSVHVVGSVWDGVTRFNPMSFAYMIITRPFNMMGKTTEVVVSGIQSVATGVGSASSIALNRLSAKNHSLSSQENLRRTRSTADKTLSQKLLKKLSSLNSAGRVIKYTEIGDNDGGLTGKEKRRVQRMMHYDVSLRPFVATVKLQESFKQDSTTNDGSDSVGDYNETSSSSSPLDGPFMCTPQSFPPTPASRAHVLKRGSRFADDVVFLARDQLRVHDGLESSNERTREMAHALTEGKRLAVFDADDASAGIDLSCGQHVATKVGNLLYCSSRSMVPILRNCFVYFEMTVLGRSGGGFIPQTSMATLSFGLSTKEMPPNTLVGAWKGSVGLCTTGQILIAGQWCSVGQDPTTTPFGDRETVGCLVCLDDSSAFETWDGVMITATITFNINGRIVSPHVPCLPTGLDQHPPTSKLPDVPVGATPPSFTLPLLVPAEEELYPTLTLHSPGTSVMCRFSAEDIIARSREDIGVPPNVAVYAVDGSLVFKGEE